MLNSRFYLFSCLDQPSVKLKIMMVFPVLIPGQNFLFPGTGKETTKCHGKGNLRKREFPLTPEPVWLTDNSSSRADWTVWEYSLCKRYFMFLCISIPFHLFCIFIPTSRHPVWNYWRNLPHHSALSVFCLFTICFKNFSKVFLFNFQIKNMCKSIISAQFKAADVMRPIDMIA